MAWELSSGLKDVQIIVKNAKIQRPGIMRLVFSSVPKKSVKGQAGLTFCGGEPFVQPEACKEIADWVRKNLGWNVWSFSGFTYEQIKKAGGAQWEFLKSLDALIDGPFIIGLKDLSLRYRGSKNQRLLHLELGTGKILDIE